jgi:hypothetical protein
MSDPAVAPLDSPPAPETPAERKSRLAALRRIGDHGAKLAAGLAVLAAMSNGQYTDRFSRTILAQAEASNAWAHYQSKSIKKNLAAGQLDIVRALAEGRADLAPAVAKLEADAKERAARYEAELAELKAKAESIEALKDKQARHGTRFQFAFIALQAGVVLSTIAGSSKKQGIWWLAAAAGLLGLLLVADGFLLLV